MPRLVSRRCAEVLDLVEVLPRCGAVEGVIQKRGEQGLCVVEPSGADVAGAQVQGCLLYTSDAADDLMATAACRTSRWAALNGHRR